MDYILIGIIGILVFLLVSAVHENMKLKREIEKYKRMNQSLAEKAFK